ncbi:MAG: TlpA disulfide reductase family protein [Bacteroidota bacterium]
MMSKTKTTRYPLGEVLKTSLCAVFFAGLLLGCGQNAGAEQLQGEVQSHLAGEITLSADIDSTADFSGFGILVADRTEEGLDTLAYTSTDTDGKFDLDITVPKSNIYSLVISREGSILRVSEIAIANNDSATMKVEFPFGRRPIMIRSNENAALLGFKNTVALHNNEMNAFSRDGVTDQQVYANKVKQTAEILWGLQDSSPGTLAASLGAAQSVVMLEGWNDSLLVARAKTVEADNVNYANIAGAARRAQIRMSGTADGATLLEEMKAKVTDEEILAAVQSELVIAYRDNNEDEKALLAARELKMQYATDSSWIRWADRAIFDLENLRPGMEAPAFSLVDSEGKAVNVEAFAGKHVILEFYIPGAEFEADLNARSAYYRAEGNDDGFEILSISLEADSLLNEAFAEGRDLPGRHVYLEDGPTASIIKAYNVYRLPTRYLIDPEGKIAGKYVLQNGVNAYQDALVLSNTSE